MDGIDVLDQPARSELTQAQSLILTGQELCPGVPLYNMAVLFTIEGPIDADRFTLAFQSVVDRCDALRTVIESVDGHPAQRVLSSLDCELTRLDFSTSANPDAALARWAQQRCESNFYLSRKSFDTALIRLSDRRYAWFYNQHHILTDASSFALIFSNVQESYRSLSRDEAATNGIPSFAKYVQYEREAFGNNHSSRQWFESKKNHVTPRLYGQEVDAPGTRSRRLTSRLGEHRSARLRQIAGDPDVRSLTPQMSLFTLFCTALFAFLYRVSGQPEIAIGAPAHNRPRRDFKRTIGLFIEVFPLSVSIDHGETFQTLLKKVKADVAEYLKHAKPGASEGRDQQSFNALLNYITVSFGDFCDLPTTSQWLHSGHCDPGHLIRLQVHDFDASGEFVLHFDLNELVFDTGLRQRVVHHFQCVLDSMLEDRNRAIDDVDLLTARERNSLIGPPAKATVASDQTVLDRFQRCVSRSPEAIALEGEDGKTTFAELNRRTDALARHLTALAVRPGDRVGLCLQRTPAAVVAILAILKCGAAFVPIDARNPRRRNKFVLDDIRATLVITQESLSDRVPDSTKTLLLDSNGAARAGEISTQSLATLPEGIDPDSAAYLIYTSGSTGRPKGVVISHRSLDHYITWADKKYVRDRVLSFPLFSPLTFDLTITSVFLPLVTGGRIVLYPESDSQSDLSIVRVVKQDLVDVVKLTPSHLTLIKDQDLRNSRVKQLILGGEDLTTDAAKAILSAFGGDVEIHNEYGPTEATVGCIVHTFDPAHDRDNSVPIGTPIDHMEAFILNDRLRPVPQGVPGELFLAGRGLADGYWNRPELTAERFLPIPFRPQQRMYRTGDLARLRDDGVMEYHGRVDRQIKVRGVRIELGDIEAAMTTHAKVSASAVNLSKTNLGVDVIQEPTHDCTRCGLPSNYPGATFDHQGICHYCSKFDAYKERAELYFRSMSDLRGLFNSSRARHPDAEYDCLSLLSGGKDSTYMLSRLVDMGLKVLAFTLDNGFISDQAKDNITRVVTALGVDHLFGSTPAMNQIFVDSLHRHANVCQGCFKTIYTLSMQVAKDKGIPLIVTGLSRGQFFETRLTEELFVDPKIDAEQIDQIVLRARKQYHRVDDAVSRLMDVSALQEDQIFEDIRFVDFYRYCDASLDEMLAHLDRKLPWVRPSDTGRSTNCLINDLGIYVHKRQRGFHNYAFPYSWDVRVGHKKRDEALDELNDDIDVDHVNAMMKKIGYEEPAPVGPAESDVDSHDQLVAYYVSDSEIDRQQWTEHLSTELPNYMIPSRFIRIDALPLTDHGKIKYSALPEPGEQRPEMRQQFVEPRNESETVLANIWQQVLRVERVGIDDNFFDLGGDSILAIQIVARANRAGLSLAPQQLFDHLTVRTLAAASSTSLVAAEQGAVTGELPLLPIQRWYFDGQADDLASLHQVLAVRFSERVDPDCMNLAISQVVRHHDALRIAYTRAQDTWEATNLPDSIDPPTLSMIDAMDSHITDSHPTWLDRVADQLCRETDIAAGRLMQVAAVGHPDEATTLLIAIHHLAIDAVSWPILLEDLSSGYVRFKAGQSPQLPAKSTSVKSWSHALTDYSSSDRLSPRTEHWQEIIQGAPTKIPEDAALDGRDYHRDAVTFSVELDETRSDRLLNRLGGEQFRVHEILLTALGIAIADWSRESVVTVDVEGHGRESIGEALDISRTIGWFTSIYPIRMYIPGPNGRETEEVLAAVGDSIRRLPENGFDYGLRRYLSTDSDRRLDGCVDASVLFNYLGRAEQLIPENSEFRFLRPLSLWRRPDSLRRHALEVNATAIGPVLRIDWTYNQIRHHQNTIATVANSFMDTLVRLVDTCVDRLKTGDVRRQFMDARIQDRQLDKLASLLKKVDSEKGQH